MSDPAGSERTPRLFVALNLPAELRATLHAAVRQAVAPLVEEAPRAVAWVPEPNLHVTVRFVGERPAALVDPLREALDLAASAVHVHDLAIGGLGAFPNLRRPRVLWIGVAMNVALAALYQKVDDACWRLAIGREARPFHPHVTIGRIRMGASVPAGRLEEAVQALTTYRWTMPVETVDLMSSELASGGSRYARLHAAALSPASGGR
ncbi:RNA 2',3'-cyclic phosphodiesterase [Roseisolibacter agri]|uniref:RNA 2',3'-cyclic phosphodiesterase n=1 Tax=Roseisolibacter agri TaxID=2014610 RepID=A0AA37V1J2_9BACT|nr:RNA 2',3'-cyclic phosphodiesterase [Roseisolibacter agri]GLC26305.1 RNA 2',3'-cyclic phosphodiesterase [Roseisolibacter agri]